ncbi:MAG TPA: hypothetical protein VMC81_07810 [Rhodocyclaceae bacterium]|nr:hypothetical protein [Rhodocyclaceae bacterium]
MKTVLWIGAAAVVAVVALLLSVGLDRLSTPLAPPAPDHLRASFDPLHFKPAALTATDGQCLACHREVIEDRVLERSPSGLTAAAVRAPYQRLSTYAGDQETFHRRHLVTPLAKQLMNLHCSTCHQGLDPRDEAPGTSATAPAQEDAGFVLRKQVNPERTCLKCHGQMNVAVMGLGGPWPEVAGEQARGCFTCHDKKRTNRHNVDYLNANAIEAAGAANADVCYGCHGGRAWYRMIYPYTRHPWPGMPKKTPEWAKGRPTE